MELRNQALHQLGRTHTNVGGSSRIRSVISIESQTDCCGLCADCFARPKIPDQSLGRDKFVCGGSQGYAVCAAKLARRVHLKREELRWRDGFYDHDYSE